jgi:hypothetical protein
MIVKDVEIDAEGHKHYVFGIDERYEYLREGILSASGAIDNEAPDLALRKLMEMANNVRAWGC